MGGYRQGTLRQIDAKPEERQQLPEAVKDRFLSATGTAKITVRDGSTHDLGVVVVRDDTLCIHVMIPKMTEIPHETSNSFGTLENNQRHVQVRVVQGLEDGERVDVDDPAFDSFKLGECTLDLPSGLPAGSEIRLTYKLNLDQTLEVTAVGPDGRTANVTIKRATLDEDEVREAASAMQMLKVE